MKPILYEANTIDFTTNGLGKLPDCISCVVTEERNGIYECEFQYPDTGLRYSDIIEGRIISVTHDDNGDRQPFIIYRRSPKLNGITTFNAYHISYMLLNVIVKPFSASSVSEAFTKFTTQNMNTNPFTFWTNNTRSGNFSLKIPSSVRGILGGVQGSILDVFGGEYEYDKFTVKNHSARGSNNGVVIRYGKNLLGLDQEVDISGLYNAVVPYWSNSDDSDVIYGDIKTATGQTQGDVTVLDLSMEFLEKPTKAQLNNKAVSYLDSNQPWVPKNTLTVDFVPLWQVDEYKDIARLERVSLCDTVTIIYKHLGIQATAKVVKVVWNVLQDRYDTIELGSAAQSFADVILSQASDYTQQQIEKTLSLYRDTSAWTAASKSAASGTWTQMASLDLKKGMNLVICGAAFGSNASGYRQICVSSASDVADVSAGRYDPSYQAANGDQTRINAIRPLYLNDNATYYLWARQNSGSSLTVYPYAYVINLTK